MKSKHSTVIMGLLMSVSMNVFSQAAPVNQANQDKNQLHYDKKEVDFYQKKVDEAVRRGDLKGAEEWEHRREQAKGVYKAQKQRVQQESPQLNHSPEDPRVHELKKQRNFFQKKEDEAVKRGDLSGAQDWRTRKEQIQRDIAATKGSYKR